MRRPGDRLRALAARVCGPATMERLIDPVIADLQCEHADAVRRGRIWRAVWIRAAGVWALCRVMAACAIAAPRTWAAADDGVLGRTLGLTAVVTAGIIFLDNLSYLPGAARQFTPAHAARSFLYLVPQAFPLAVSTGLLAGVAFGLRGCPITSRLRRAVLGIGVCCAVAAFVTLAWIAPISNQAFRSAASGIPSEKLGKGTAELTLMELRAHREALDAGAMRDSVQARHAAVSYQWRLMFSLTPIVLAMFGLALAEVGRKARAAAIGAWACSACVVYWLMLIASGQAVVLGGVSALIVWMPNAVFALATAMLRSREHSQASNPKHSQE